MATSTSDIPGFDAISTTLKEKKNLLIGAACIVALVLVLMSFIRSQIENSRLAPWREALDLSMPWEMDPDELARRAQEVKGTDAEPILRYWEMVRLYENKDEATALQRLNEFKAAFPDHYLLKRGLIVPANPGSDLTPATSRFEHQALELKAWGMRYPAPTANPAPDSRKVVVTTDRGSIVFGLYETLSRETCELLVKAVEALQGSFIVQARDGEWIELGHNQDGTAREFDAGSEKFPPLEINDLYHFKGSVAFSQRPLSAAPHNPQLKIWLADSFRDDGSSTVLGTVLEGLDLLDPLSKEAKAEDMPTRLAAQVSITGIRIE